MPKMPHSTTLKQLAAFSKHLREQGLSQGTAKTYRIVAAQVDWNNPVQWYKDSLVKQLAKSTSMLYRAVAVHVLVYHHGLSKRDATLALPSAAGRKNAVKRGLTDEQLTLYYAAAETYPEPDRSVLLLLPRTGLRVSEACGLRVDEVQQRGKSWLIALSSARGKGGKARDVPLSPAALQLVSGCRKLFPNRSYFFPARARGQGKRYIDRPISAQTIAKSTREIAAKHPELKGLTPHILRHTFATRVHRGTSLRNVQELLGHESISSTTRYVQTEWDALTEAVDAADK